VTADNSEGADKTYCGSFIHRQQLL